MKCKILLTATFIILVMSSSFGQDIANSEKNGFSDFFIEGFVGTQISGMKKEDFVSSNFSPYVQISLGKEFNDRVEASINYQGPFFYFISDEFKHKYIYLGADARIKLNDWDKKGRKLNFYILGGGGYFYNDFNENDKFCFNLGGIIAYKLPNDFQLRLKGSGIIGWRIYQHDKDILPNVSIGLHKKFR